MTGFFAALNAGPYGEASRQLREQREVAKRNADKPVFFYVPAPLPGFDIGAAKKRQN